MKPIIRVENLSKQYRLGANQSPQMTFRETLVAAAKSPINKFKKTEEQKEEQSFWALKDVNFEIYPGEVVGIIGRNGAGKSTLLKILSRITEPTNGKIELFGRVGSLLEVGTGFHPELTGRENIFLNGAILGMRREEIARKFDEIVDFAEVEKFIDTPVKHYSSGMYTRLAFAVAANLEPEILIVDEVLAVGDAEFQKKCLGKMKDVSEHGRTVLFVSHNIAAIKSLCNKGIYLEDGKVSCLGNIEQVANSYINKGISLSEFFRDEPVNKDSSLLAYIKRVKFNRDKPNNSNEFSINAGFEIEIEYDVIKENSILNLSISIYSTDGVYLLASPSISDGRWFQKPHPIGKYKSVCKIPDRLFNQGKFEVSIILVKDGTEPIDYLEKCVSFEMIDTGEENASFFGKWNGIIRPRFEWQTSLLSRNDKD